MILSSFFLTLRESFRFLISTRCSAHFDSYGDANMIYERGKIRNFGLVAAFYVLSLALKTSFSPQKRCRYIFGQLFCAPVASKTLKVRF